MSNEAEELTQDEEALRVAFADAGLEDEEKGDEIEADEEAAIKPEYSAIELEAREDGHTTKAEWVEAGKDPDEWKSAKRYIEHGQMLNSLSKSKADLDNLRKETDKRFASLNKLHKAETDAKIKALKSEQRKAVEEADTEAYDNAQEQLEELKIAPEPIEEPEPTSNKSPEVVAWEKANPWINDDNDPRSADAIDFWEGYIKRNPDSNSAAALKHVDKKMAALYKKEAKINPRREVPSETGRAPSTPQSSSNKPSMGNLTAEERNLWNDAGRDIWPDGKGGRSEKDFLQSIADSRKG